MEKEKYDHSKIEKKWQDSWEKAQIFKVKESDSGNKNFYCLDMFPYPSGQGLHVGHPRGYTATDVYARYMRMKGFNVLHPMGWDAFGLPAENYAIKNKIHPSLAVQQNIQKFKKQISSFGFSYDWSREINTTDPNYYKWTQWIFLKMFKRGLAYESNTPINWCPACQTGLANEEVVAGKCERCHAPVVQKKIRQWMLKITQYADRLLNDLDGLDWPESIKTMQRNWIGRSEGAEIQFKIYNSQFSISVFTTRADTIFGATYLAVAPEYFTSNLKIQISKFNLKIQNLPEIERYCATTEKQLNIIKQSSAKDKTGVEIKGIRVVNPANGKIIPIFVSNYVLNEYGTGAIMAVPAHDARDFEFAIKYDLPIIQVIEPCFVSTAGADAVRKNLTYVEREAILAIVKHWSKDEYIGLKWKRVAWQTFITGGPEKGQSAENGAITEIIEETGYLHPKLIKELGGVHSQFYHTPKKVNRFAHFRVFYFELQDGEQIKISDVEKSRHDIRWVTRNQMKNFLTPDSHKYSWDEFSNGLQVHLATGIMINSDKYNRMESKDGAQKIIDDLTRKKLAKKQTQFKLRDWVFSRQRYWGEPIPIIYCRKCWENSKSKSQISILRKNIDYSIRNGIEYMIIPVSEKDLPVLLPEVKSYKPTGTGESPLANIREWVNTKCPTCGGKAQRETNTMPQWAGSCWYYLAYLAKKNSKLEILNSKLFDKWLPVDTYVGGAEHAVLHLLYARFWHKVLFDEKIVDSKEPFQKLINVGMIVAPDGQKMSKSRGNVINPDDLIKKYGADSLRLTELFIGPFSQSTQWNQNGIVGMRKFLERVIFIKSMISPKLNQNTENSLNQMLAKVDNDTRSFQFNTAISAMIIFVNLCIKEKSISKNQYQKLLTILSLFAPHIAQELWSKLDENSFICQQQFPCFYPQEKSKVITIPIQVNGKVRGEIKINTTDNNKLIIKEAKSNPKIKPWLCGKIIKTIYIPWKIINFVVK